MGNTELRSELMRSSISDELKLTTNATLISSLIGVANTISKPLTIA